jgi:hypothetical protein
MCRVWANDFNLAVSRILAFGPNNQFRRPRWRHSLSRIQDNERLSNLTDFVGYVVGNQLKVCNGCMSLHEGVDGHD